MHIPSTHGQVADASCSLPRNQVPEWASAYINYKGLKKLIKAAVETARRGEQVDLAGGQPRLRASRGLRPVA